MASLPPSQPAATLPGASAPMEVVTTANESRLWISMPITLDTTISAAACSALVRLTLKQYPIISNGVRRKTPI